MKTGLPMSHCQVVEPHGWVPANQKRPGYVTYSGIITSDPSAVACSHSDFSVLPLHAPTCPHTKINSGKLMKTIHSSTDVPNVVGWRLRRIPKNGNTTFYHIAYSPTFLCTRGSVIWAAAFSLSSDFFSLLNFLRYKLTVKSMYYKYRAVVNSICCYTFV